MATLRLRPPGMPPLSPIVVTPRPVQPRAPTAPLAPSRPTAASALQRADVILAELEALRAEMARAMHRVGVLLAELQDPALIAAKGFTRWEDLLQAHGLPAKPTALKYVAVAKSFSAEEAAELGVEKGYALVRYARDVLGDRKPPALLLRENSKIGGTTLHEHSPSSLLATVQDLVQRKRARDEPETDTADEVDAAVRKLGPRLRRAGAPTASLRRVRRRGGYRVLVELDPDEAVELAKRLKGV